VNALKISRVNAPFQTRDNGVRGKESEKEGGGTQPVSTAELSKNGKGESHRPRKFIPIYQNLVENVPLRSNREDH